MNGQNSVLECIECLDYYYDKNRLLLKERFFYEIYIINKTCIYLSIFKYFKWIRTI